VRLLLSCGDVLLWRKGEHERGELTDLTGYPFNRLALQTLLRRVLRGLITFGSFHESRDSMLTRRKFFATTVCIVACRRQPMIRGVRYVFGLSPHASQFAAVGRELRRVLFRRESTSLRDASHSGSVGAGKGLPTIFFTGLREPTPPFALNFWRAGGGGFEFRGSRRLWRKLLRAFYI
jgi:hypothetical protein